MAIDLKKYTQSRWLKGSDLPVGRLTTLTVKALREHTFERTQETKPCLDFVETDQSLAMGHAQITTMEALFSVNNDLWIGQKVNLQPAPSGIPGKPTIMITAAEVLPTFNGRTVGSAATQPTVQPSSEHPF